MAFAPSRPNIVYALVEASKNGFYRSTDGGQNWTLVNNEADVHNRPFYYSRVLVNPANENIVHLLQTQPG